MKYIDSGTRDSDQALGSWLETELTPEVNGLRWQSGFFSLDGLSPFVATLERLAGEDQLVRALIGSNNGDSLKSHVAGLVGYLGLPRDNGQLGIISYEGAFYHPKIYHLCRTDGSQAAYVGSANLTSSGIESLHVEAGLLIDSREGDSVDVLNQIASSIDAWFDGTRPGVNIVENEGDLDGLEEDGILASAPPARVPVPRGANGEQGENRRPRLQRLIRFPTLSVPAEEAEAAVEEGEVDVQATPSPEAGFVGTEAVLIAEIGGGERWKQANFPIALIRNFFEVEPGSHELITLYNVAEDGAIAAEEHPPIVAVQSQNYRFELNSVSGLPYPDAGRPIGIFLRLAMHEFNTSEH